MYTRRTDRYTITDYRTITTIYRHQRLKILVIDVFIFFGAIKLDRMIQSH